MTNWPRTNERNAKSRMNQIQLTKLFLLNPICLFNKFIPSSSFLSSLPQFEMMDFEQWNLIESDPGTLANFSFLLLAIFTEIFERFGVKNVKVEDVYSLEEADFVERNCTAHALIFLFKWDPSIVSLGEKVESNEIYFAKQIVKDACATQAIINSLMNLPQFELGPELQEFKRNTHDLPADLKGVAIGQNRLFRDVHNSFSPDSLFHYKREPKKDEESESFHFISYVPYNGNGVLELDGLQEHAILHPDKTGGSWLGNALECIKNRINAYSGYLKFDLLAVVKDRRQEISEEIALLASITSPSDQDQHHLRELQTQLQNEEENYQLGKMENEKRRANYIPLIVEILKIAEEQNKLDQFI